MNTYLVRVQHDHGTVSLMVHAATMAAAIEMVKNAEGCPEGAIKGIKIT
jgi:hypothetical protein